MNVYRVISMPDFNDYGFHAAATEAHALAAVLQVDDPAAVDLEGWDVIEYGSCEDAASARELVRAIDATNSMYWPAYDDQEVFPDGEAKLWRRPDGSFFLAPLDEDHVGNGSGARHFGDVCLATGELTVRHR